MKILLISRTFYPEGMGGGEISALHIAKTLSDEKNKVIVCTLSEKIKKPTIEYVEKIKIYRFPWKKLKWSKKLSNLEYVYYQLHKNVKKVIKTEKPEILHLLNGQTVFPLLLSIKNIKKFITINGPIFCDFGGSHPDGKTCYNCSSKERFMISLKKWETKGLFYWMYNKYHTFLLKQSLKKSNKIFAVSNAIKKMLIFGGIKEKKISVIHNPIEINKKIKTDLKKKLKISENKKIIFYAGRLSENKGIDRTIKTIKNIDNVVFLIAGRKRDYYSKLKNLTKKLNLEKEVKFLGFIDNNKLKEYYSITDLVVHPCRVYDSLSRMLLESASYGIPLIATNVGGNSEIIKNNLNGFLINSDLELKEKIEYLINHQEISKQMGEKSKEIIENNFSYKQIKLQLIREYRK